MTEEITVEAVGGSDQPPAEIQEKAQLVEEQIKARIEENKAKVKAAAAKGVELAAAGPILVGGYQYWDVLTLGPYQFFGDPPYRPNKIIAWNEWAFFFAGIWINPLNSPGGGLSGTTVFGARSYNAYFESINLTNVADGPDLHIAGTFPSPAPDFTLLWWPIPPNSLPNPGARPNLYEVNFTIDVVELGQPMAAFNTWHYDPDREPGFPTNEPWWFQWFFGSVPDVPVVQPQLQHDNPARFLVYQKD
jgi:hypothetical protein